MSTSLSENPVVLEPRKHLTGPQCTALVAINNYRHSRTNRSGELEIGRHRFKPSTVNALHKHGLITPSRTGFDPTLAGELAFARLKGETP